ncbi:MAG: GxxExxY protein [Chromatiales bacterium]|nr:GxxExxY protein [Chromatiales bacterium]
MNELTERVIGAAIEVHKAPGPGYLESVYEAAFAIELELRNVTFERQPQFKQAYKGREVGIARPDFLVERELIVELKAVESLLPIHTAQIISYLRTTGVHLGLLLNFNVTIMKSGVRRVVLSD